MTARNCQIISRSIMLKIHLISGDYAMNEYEKFSAAAGTKFGGNT